MNKIIINIKFAIAVILTTMLFVGTPIEVSAQTLVLKEKGVFITSKDTLSYKEAFSQKQSITFKSIDAKALQLLSSEVFTITSGKDTIFQANIKDSLSENEIKKNAKKGTITLVASKKYEIHIGNDYVKELNKVSGTTNINDNKKLVLKKNSDSNSSSLVKYIILCFVLLIFVPLCIYVVYKKNKSKGEMQKNPTEDLKKIEEAHDEEDTTAASSEGESNPHKLDNTQDSNDPAESKRLSDALKEKEELEHKNEVLCEIVTKICEHLKLNTNVDYVLKYGASVIYEEIKDLKNAISAQGNGDKSQDESHLKIYKELIKVFRSEEHIGKLMQETLDEQKCQSDLDTFKKFAKIVDSKLRNAKKEPETIDFESLLKKQENQHALKMRVFEIMERAKLPVLERNKLLQDNFEAIQAKLSSSSAESNVSDLVSEAIKNDKLSDKDKLVIAQNIENKINAAIKDTAKLLPNVNSYENLLNVIAERIQAPNSYEEAEIRIQEKDVEVVNSILGSSLKAIDKQSMETAIWSFVASFISKLGQDVNPDKDSIKERVRTIKMFIEEVNELKKATGADALSDVEKCVRQKELKRILDSNKIISALIPEASAAESTESLINKLVRCISENNTAYELIVEELKKQLQERQIQYNESTNDAVDLFASFAMDIVKKEKEKSETIKAQNLDIEEKQKEIDIKEQSITNLKLERSELLKEASDSVGKLQKLTENVKSHNQSVVRACSDSEEDLCNSIDDSLFYGINQSMEVLGAYKADDNDYPVKVKADIAALIEQELTKENSAIATAYRYYAYSMLPFMTDDSRTHGIVFERRKMIALKESLDDLMTQFGVKVIVPPLFTMGVDEADYEDVTGKVYADLDNLCPGSRNHVDNVDTQKAPNKMVVDIHLVGYAINGNVKRKPQVLTF